MKSKTFLRYSPLTTATADGSKMAASRNSFNHHWCYVPMVPDGRRLTPICVPTISTRSARFAKVISGSSSPSDHEGESKDAHELAYRITTFLRRSCVLLIGVFFLGLWIAGLVTSVTLGGFIHVLLVLSVMALLSCLIRGGNSRRLAELRVSTAHAGTSGNDGK
jgi:hypothetical protein